jgi:hypothetical protein
MSRSINVSWRSGSGDALGLLLLIENDFRYVAMRIDRTVFRSKPSRLDSFRTRFEALIWRRLR